MANIRQKMKKILVQNFSSNLVFQIEWFIFEVLYNVECGLFNYSLAILLNSRPYYRTHNILHTFFATFVNGVLTR